MLSPMPTTCAAVVAGGMLLVACEERRADEPIVVAQREAPVRHSTHRDVRAQHTQGGPAQRYRAQNEVLCRNEDTGQVNEACLRRHAALDEALQAYAFERSCTDEDGRVDRKCTARKTRLDGELSRPEDK